MEISGPDRAQYRKEIQEGVQIFEKGFKEIQKKKTFPAQKQEYETSMEESLKAIQDAAKALANESMQKMKERLEADYDNYLSSPTEANKEKVQRDIDNLKHS